MQRRRYRWLQHEVLTVVINESDPSQVDLAFVKVFKIKRQEQLNPTRPATHLMNTKHNSHNMTIKQRKEHKLMNALEEVSFKSSRSKCIPNDLFRSSKEMYLSIDEN